MFSAKSKKAEPTPFQIPAEAPRPEPEAINPPCQPIHNVIARGTVIQGNIEAEGDLLIEGTVRGDVTTKTKLIVGPTCVIEGNIMADHAEVAGQVKGTVQALGLLVIKSSSLIDGDVLTKNLNVESGSTFNGRFTVGSVTSTNNRKAETPAVKSDASVLNGDNRRVAAALPVTATKI